MLFSTATIATAFVALTSVVSAAPVQVEERGLGNWLKTHNPFAKTNTDLQMLPNANKASSKDTAACEPSTYITSADYLYQYSKLGWLMTHPNNWHVIDVREHAYFHKEHLEHAGNYPVKIDGNGDPADTEGLAKDFAVTQRKELPKAFQQIPPHTRYVVIVGTGSSTVAAKVAAAYSVYAQSQAPDQMMVVLQGGQDALVAYKKFDMEHHLL